MIPVENYLGSFGDNYCIGCNNLGMHFPDRDTNHRMAARRPDSRASAGPANRVRCSISTAGTRRYTPGALRGMFDVNDGQTVRLASVTDGTSNTIAAGEGLPAQRADNNVWEWNSGANGTTVPINYSPG